ncbi:MAG: hypothetical protein R2695_08795 [Acidimicrobiales bacterium]
MKFHLSRGRARLAPIVEGTLMGIDDDLREVFHRATAPSPDPATVRRALGPAMLRAHAARRIRSRRSAGRERSRADRDGGGRVPRHRRGPDAGHPGPLAPADRRFRAGPGADRHGPGQRPDTTGTAPGTTEPPAPTTIPAPVSSAIDTPGVTTPRSPDEPEPAPTTPPAPDDPGLSGPHTTRCGTVTFAVGASTVRVTEHTTAIPGYRVEVQGDGTSEVEMKWIEGPGAECKVAAHLEHGQLEIEKDR